MQAADIGAIPGKVAGWFGSHFRRIGTIFGRLHYTLKVSMMDLGYWSPKTSAPVTPPAPKKPTGIHAENVSVERVFGGISGPQVQILGFDIWTEGSSPCKEHCYHDMPISGRHTKEMGLKKGSYHADAVCCRCTHGACSTASAVYVDHVVSFSNAIGVASGVDVVSKPGSI